MQFDSLSFLLKELTFISSCLVDTDWVKNIDNRTPTSAYIVFLDASAISWSSKKQSPTEVEYKAVASTASEITWIQFLFHEIGVTTITMPTIMPTRFLSHE